MKYLKLLALFVVVLGLLAAPAPAAPPDLTPLTFVGEQIGQCEDDGSLLEIKYYTEKDGSDSGVIELLRNGVQIVVRLAVDGPFYITALDEIVPKSILLDRWPSPCDVPVPEPPPAKPTA